MTLELFCTGFEAPQRSGENTGKARRLRDGHAGASQPNIFRCLNQGERALKPWHEFHGQDTKR